MKTCAAINTFNQWPYVAGEPCGDEATDEVKGFPVCWCHKQACAVRTVEFATPHEGTATAAE